MNRPTVGRLRALERLLKDDAIMLPRFRQAGGMGIVLSKAMNQPHDFVRTDTAYVLDLDFLPGISAHAKLLDVGGKTVVDAGSLVSAGVTSIVSEDADGETLDTYTIPAEVQALPGYGWSAGSVCNYIDFEHKKYVRRVASIDLGDLTWHKNSQGIFSNYSSDSQTPWIDAGGKAKGVSSSSVVANIECAEYEPIDRTSLVTTDYDNVLAIAINGYPLVYDSGKASMTAAEFKTAVSGIMLYYELATPIETDISAYLTDDAMLAVESGGTLTFTNSNQIPVPSKIEYQRRSKDNS